QPNGFQLEFERVARSFRLVHLLDSPCLSLNAQQGIRFSGASSYLSIFIGQIFLHSHYLVVIL
ncbi:hypothetical protein, partial [Burkholderia contaminans]|uniref:hypothetical protein n=1 Tax=Burkholderia contaminans TaxID=488447 RepID=UPI001CF3F142